jgi:c-di-GMP-binding flagellar brake protein YcgR
MAPSNASGCLDDTAGDTIHLTEHTMLRSDRRKRRRADLHCTLYISKNTETRLLTCRTRNISSSGFYCVSEEALTPGEQVQCTIVFPDTGNVSDGFALECSVEVLRVEPIQSGESYGLACRIQDYSVVPQPIHLVTIH